MSPKTICTGFITARAVADQSCCRYSIQINDDDENQSNMFARHASRAPTGQTVAVETDVPVTGTVTLTATQGIFTDGNRL